MRVIIAPDSFKESLPAPEVASALARGWLVGRPDDEVLCIPMSDGGEGTADAMVSAMNGRFVLERVSNPLGEPIDATYGLFARETKAVVEMASASGLPLVPLERRNPGLTTTYGTGELIRAALERGVTEIIVAIGGSATNDGGVGMAQALGYRFLDAHGQELPPGGLAIERLERIDISAAHSALQRCHIRIACDVNNPLCGPHGASSVYGPQKGATPDLVERLDSALARLAVIVARDLGISIAELPGSGAAGGLGGGLVAFAGGIMEPGVAVVADACELSERMRGAGLVITGEGRIDGQSVHGKTPVGVARIARGLGIPAIGIAGALGSGFEAVHSEGLIATFSIASGPGSLEQALAHTERRLVECAAALSRYWSLGADRGSPN